MVGAYHEDVSETMQWWRDNEWKKRRRSNRWHKSFSCIFPYVSFYTPFLLNPPFILHFLFMSWYVTWFYVPLCAYFSLSFLCLPCVTKQEWNSYRIKHFCPFAFKCQLKLCGQWVMLIYFCWCVCSWRDSEFLKVDAVIFTQIYINFHRTLMSCVCFSHVRRRSGWCWQCNTCAFVSTPLLSVCNRSVLSLM